jgi:hypothetical protein
LINIRKLCSAPYTLPNSSLIIGPAKTVEMISITKTGFVVVEIREPEMRKADPWGRMQGNLQAG